MLHEALPSLQCDEGHSACPAKRTTLLRVQHVALGASRAPQHDVMNHDGRLEEGSIALQGPSEVNSELSLE